MKFIVGQRLRVSALFKNAERAFDPQDVTATFTQGGVSSTFTVGEGVRRTGVVGECFIEVLLLHTGPIAVCFSSITPGQEGTQSATYEVSSTSALPAAAVHEPPVVSVKKPVVAAPQAQGVVTPKAPTPAPPEMSERKRKRLKHLKLKHKIGMAKVADKKKLIIVLK